MYHRRLLTGIPGLILAAALAGCGVGPGAVAGPATLTVTDGFGVDRVGGQASGEVTASETAMRQLERHHRVGTSYGGRYVTSIDGRGGGTVAGRPVDWFFYVNGVESPVGAAEARLNTGDDVWWDRRDWGGAVHVPAVVGAWPQPFRSGVAGKRLPVKIVCAPGSEGQCKAVEAALAKVGVTASRGIAGTAGTGSGLRILIGNWQAIRNDPSSRGIEAGPAVSGVYARPVDRGGSFELLDPSGRVVRALGRGAGLVAATSTGAGPPTWVVTGVDQAGVEQAARSLGAEKLSRRYAVALEVTGAAVPLPVVDR